MDSKLHTLEEYQENLNLQLFNIDSVCQNDNRKIEDLGDLLHFGLLINHKNGSNIYMNEASCNILNYTLDEIEALGTQYVNSGLFHETEMDSIIHRVNEFYERNDEKEILSFFQRIRPQGKDEYEWMFITSKLIKREGIDFLQERLLVACPVNMMGDMSGKINRVLDENDYMRKNFRKFVLLTKREKEILTLVAKGNDNPFIAEKLFISRHTVEQHRKNIRSKIEFRNIAEIIRFAAAFELI